MKKYVALATDFKPQYAVFAPIVVRLWNFCGYTPILFAHDSSEWESGHGPTVMAELGKLEHCGMVHVRHIPRIEPLSIGNTMRVSRLAAAAVDFVESDDFILTADVDMAPLDPLFFARDPQQAWVLRCDMYGSLEGASAVLHNGTRGLVAGLFRFPLCYIGMPASLWRSVLPLIVGDPVRSIRNLNHGLRHDAHDHDEACCSARLLLHAIAAGSLSCTTADGSDPWVQGGLNLVPMTDSRGQPKRMLIGGAASGPKTDAVDWHFKAAGMWIKDTLALYWPSEKEFLDDYWPRVYQALEG